MMSGEVEAKPKPTVEDAPRPVPKLPVIRKFVANPTQNRLVGVSQYPITTSRMAAGTAKAGITQRRPNRSHSQPQSQYAKIAQNIQIDRYRPITGKPRCLSFAR